MLYRGIAYHTNEKCPRCRGELWSIDPPISNWHLYCPNCQALTTTEEDIRSQLAKLDKGAIGVIASVSFKLELINNQREP